MERKREGREREREGGREGGCCQRKMAAATSSLSWYTETTSRLREREQEREDERERLGKWGEMKRECESLGFSWKEDKERERGDPGVGCCKRRATPSHGGRVSRYIFIFNIAHIEPSARTDREISTAINVTPTQHHARVSQSVLL